MDDSCKFCRIVNCDDPDAREVYRDDNVVAFFPTEPALLGHILIIPRRHVPNIWKLRLDEAAQLSKVTIILAHAIRESVKPEGLNVIQSNGEAATQTIRHLHIHLVPRWKNDPIGSIWPNKVVSHSSVDKDRAVLNIRNAIQQVCAPDRDYSCSSFASSPSPEDKRKHLDYVQAVVARQAAASSAAKGWLIPIITATSGLAVTQHSRSLAILGIAAVALFAYLDANYLRSEKQFRQLYHLIARSNHRLPPFTLDPTDIKNFSETTGSPKRNFIREYIPDLSVWISWSIAPFYLVLLILSLGVLCASAR